MTFSYAVYEALGNALHGVDFAFCFSTCGAGLLMSSPLLVYIDGGEPGILLQIVT